MPLPSRRQAPPGGGGAASFSVIGPSGSSRGYERHPSRAPWLMVPVGGSRALALNAGDGGSPAIRNATGQGYLLDHKRTPVCWASIGGSQLFLRGIAPRRDIPVDLVHRGRALRVVVSTKVTRTLPIIAHYVEHAPGLKTAMTGTLLRSMIDGANALLRQANVQLSLAIESSLTHERIFRPDPGQPAAADPQSRFGPSLGRVVRGEEWEHLLVRHSLTLPDPRARGVDSEYKPLNIFFVPRYEKTRLAEGIVASTDNKGTCVFEDHRNATLAAETLAHEAVHHLMYLAGDDGEHHVERDRTNLMFAENTRPDGTRLTRAQIETINYSAEAFPDLRLIDPFS